MDWIKIRKGVRQGCILSPCLFNFCAEYIMQNARLDEAQTGIKIAQKNINNLRYVDDTTLMAESEEEKMSILMKMKKESEKSSLKLNIQKTKIMASSSITSCQIDEETMETMTDFIFLGLQNHWSLWVQPWNLKTVVPWKKSYDKPREHIRNQRHYFADKGPSSQSYGFSSSHLWMSEFDHKEGWALKNWSFQTEVMEKTPESSLDSKEIKSVNPKGNQPWIFIGRFDAETEAAVFWPPNVKSWLIEKNLDAGKDWGQEEKGVTEDEMVV